MRKIIFYLITIMMFVTGYSAHAETIQLDGYHLTLEQAWKIVDGTQVAIAPEAMDRLKKSHELVMNAARSGAEIYGLTVGVGLNKDHKLFDAKGELSAEAKEASKRFNYSTLRAHAVGVGPMMEPRLVRLSMVLRLNTLLTGRSGIQPRVAELYVEFLNKGITPLVPSRGSIGDADITLASHVGLVMVGEWQAQVDGKTVDASQALKQKNITPLIPEGKDALAILSNNSVGMAYALDAYREAKQIAEISPVVYGLTLEGLNGNVAPFLQQVVASHPFPGLEDTAAKLRLTLSGSYLWNADSQRALQDPLCFRTTVYTLSELQQALNDLERVISIQINSSDDNPGVLLNAEKLDTDKSQVAQYYVDDEKLPGAIIPTANFEPLPVALALQRTTLAMGHVAHNSVQRTLRLGDEKFTGLSRYLAAPDNMGHAFGAVQDALVSIHAENIDLANPVSLDGFPVEGNIEDTMSNLPRAAQRLRHVADNLRVIYSIELLHSAQAIDLRKTKNPNVVLSAQTGQLYKQYRHEVPFVNQDRIFTTDLEKGEKLLRSYKPVN